MTGRKALRTVSSCDQSPLASALREKEDNIYVARGMLVAYGNDEVKRLGFLMTFMTSSSKYQ